MGFCPVFKKTLHKCQTFGTNQHCTMADISPLLAARLHELKATFEGNLSCMMRGGFVSSAMTLRYLEHLELEMLKWQQVMARPVPDFAACTADMAASDATANFAVVDDIIVVNTVNTDKTVNADNTDNFADTGATATQQLDVIVDISDDNDDDSTQILMATAEEDKATAEAAATAVEKIATAEAAATEVEKIATEAEPATAVEEISTAVAAAENDDDDGENAQRDPFMTPFTTFDILELDIFLQPLVLQSESPLTLAASPDTSATATMVAPPSLSSSRQPAWSYPYAVYRYDPLKPPTPPPTPTPKTPFLTSESTLQTQFTQKALKTLTPKPLPTVVTPEPKRQRNVLRAVNTGFSAADSTVEYSTVDYFPDFEDNAPTHALLTRAPPKYAPPKFDVFRIKNYKQ
jgi:hypothetical protein